MMLLKHSFALPKLLHPASFRQRYRSMMAISRANIHFGACLGASHPSCEDGGGLGIRNAAPSAFLASAAASSVTASSQTWRMPRPIGQVVSVMLHLKGWPGAHRRYGIPLRQLLLDVSDPRARAGFQSEGVWCLVECATHFLSRPPHG